jgi:hypothetical protein
VDLAAAMEMATPAQRLARVRAFVTARALVLALATEPATQTSMAFATVRASRSAQALALGALSAGAGANQLSLDKKLAVMYRQFFDSLF